MSFQIRKYNEEEHQMVRDWANKEGWNEGVYDYLAFKQIDKDGFWMGVLNGQPIASLCAVQYDENFAFIGLYITKPQYRGKGYGFQVWKQALSRITAKNIALEGVLAQQQNYAKSGFKTYHRTIRYSTNGINKHFHFQHVVECKDIDFEQLCTYDRLNYPAARKAFLKVWITQPQSKAIAVVKDGKIKGYGVLRPSYEGYRIGPLSADQFQVANQILSTLLGSLPQQTKVFFDIPDINQDALRLVQKFKMVAGFVCARMYTNGMPDIQTYKTVYGIASIQFG